MKTDAKARRSTAWLRLWRWLLAGELPTTDSNGSEREAAGG